MIVKKHVSQGRLVLAACDNAILNKKIEKDEVVLDLSSQFYKGAETPKDEFLTLVKKAYIVNAVGKETVAALLEADIVSNEEVMDVQGTPYVQILFEG